MTGPPGLEDLTAQRCKERAVADEEIAFNVTFVEETAPFDDPLTEDSVFLPVLGKNVLFHPKYYRRRDNSSL